MNWQKIHPATMQIADRCLPVFFGCDLEMYRILREQMLCALGNFIFIVDQSIFLLLGMMAYCCFITVCLVMFAGNFACLLKFYT